MKGIVLFVLFVIIMWTCWSMWPRTEPVVQMEQMVMPTLTDASQVRDVGMANSPPKKILYWGKYFHIPWKDTMFPQGNVSCSGGVRCFLTDDERDLVSSDAVVVHSRTPLKKLPSASLRPPRQLWVLLTRESPPHAGEFYRERSIINLTMTYLRKSDIVANYGKASPGRFGGGFNSSRNYLEGKNRSAVAVISYCMQKRLEYVRELSKFIDVDVYGECGEQKLCDNCWESLRHYKFYLSFENSVCIDYVTEKFYRNGLKFGMHVPVVLGGANYSDPSVAPPGSYINARDFASVQELAEFLAKVGSEPQLYNRYFQWHSNYEITEVYPGMCQVCVLLYQNRTTKVYEDVMQWYRTEGQCEPYPSVTHT